MRRTITSAAHGLWHHTTGPIPNGRLRGMPAVPTSSKSRSGYTACTPHPTPHTAHTTTLPLHHCCCPCPCPCPTDANTAAACSASCRRIAVTNTGSGAVVKMVAG